ncbi:MAG: SDR family oxidoreductase [Spirochaetales bacterium]|nr:SDR family oxidoreductase [Spirochaetales bacterium]
MNAFITGGSRGIGREIVLKYISEGWGVAFTYSSNEVAAAETIELARKKNKSAKIMSYRLDQKKSDEVEKTVEKAIQDFGDFAVLVNNAAVVRNNAAAFMSDEEWDEVIATNLSGPFYLIRSFLMHFLSNRFGRIINISSLAEDGASGQINYAASKAGLIGMTRTLAREYGAKNITTNIVTVGYVPTDMTESNMADRLSKIWLEYCPVKRVGKAEEIASAVYYLTSSEAGFINGEILRVAGGLTYVP